MNVVYIFLYLPTSSSSLSKQLSIYLLLHVVYIFLYLPPPLLLYLSISLSIYWRMLYTSLNLSNSLSIYCYMLYTSSCPYLLLFSIKVILYLYIVVCCIHVPVPTSSSSYLSKYLVYISPSFVTCCIHLSI